MNADPTLELDVMAHRYLYYVLAAPVISDREYDILEAIALRELPDDSPARMLGSSIAEHYTLEAIRRAEWLLANKIVSTR